MKRAVLFSLSALALLAARPVLAAESVYTTIDLEKCENLDKAASEEDEGGGFFEVLCPGYKDYKVLVKEGDLRQAIYYGFLDQRIVEQAFQTFGYFNNMSGKLEWRIGADGKPHATIMRFFIAGYNPDTGDNEKAREGQVLVVSRVGQPDDKLGCVVGYVDAKANKDANELARKVADEQAAGFVCGTDKPEFTGVVGPYVGDQPNYQFPDLAQ